MLKPIVYFLMAVLFVIFSTQNMESVRLYILGGRPLDLPLILIIGISFLSGYAFALFGVLYRAMKKNRANANGRESMNGLMNKERGH
jgi:uncharacterized integral membrane protein